MATDPGGINAGIANWLSESPAIAAAFADPGGALKLRDSQEPAAFRLPFLTVGSYSGRGVMDSDRTFMEEVTLTVSVYASGKDACRRLAEAVNDWLLSGHNQVYVGDGACTLYPGGMVQYVREPELSPTGGDVFRADLPFKTILGRTLPA